MNRDKKSATWNYKLNLEVWFRCIKIGQLLKEWLQSKGSPFFKEIYRPVIWNLTFEIVLENKHNIFDELVTLN